MNENIIVVGLTGGIASGKSVVAKFFREEGVPVLDADELGHLVLEPDGEAYKPVIETFGDDILDDEKRIDRQKLGAKVFDNPEQRKILEQLTHPAIGRLAKKGMQIIHESGAPLAFYEAALLVEAGIYKSLNALVVVACSTNNQMNRIVARDELTKEAAAVRIASQYPLEEKIKVADYVIYNDDSIEQLQQSAKDTLRQIRQKFNIE